MPLKKQAQGERAKPNAVHVCLGSNKKEESTRVIEVFCASVDKHRAERNDLLVLPLPLIHKPRQFKETK